MNSILFWNFSDHRTKSIDQTYRGAGPRLEESSRLGWSKMSLRAANVRDRPGSRIWRPVFSV